MSKSHEEAIAHLNYAISHGDGFVEISGEVGTGKTTLCRVFLEDLDKNTEVAYIFNPRLDSIELLRAINDEFGIPADAGNAKELIDTLNTFLMENKSQKKNAILLIDEAQNLSKEVLEQLRLLSNLETNTNKLLQIILVGQPELQKMLDSQELRQLRQRITLRWFLTPLSRKETRAYIRHRVKVASKESEEKFTPAAYRRIYKYSGGIPRLINILCDRAFLTAFGFSRRKVTGSIAGSSIKELRARGENTHPFFTKRKLLTGLTVLLCLALAWTFRSQIPFINNPGTADSKESAGKPGAALKIPGKFANFLGDLTNRSSRIIAVKTTISRWKTTPKLNRYLHDIDDDGTFFRFAAAGNNFQLLTVNENPGLIKKLNLPAVLEFLPPGVTSPRYLALIKMTKNEILLKGGEENEVVSVTAEEMLSYWNGNAYIPWKNFFDYRGDIPIDAPKESVFTLKMLLLDIGFKEIKLDHTYDDFTKETVKKIQEKHGIEVDGIVGPQTKIVIYNEKKEFKIPHLRPFNHFPGDKKPGNRARRSIEK
jgi:general secretion pathway protein A